MPVRPCRLRDSHQGSPLKCAGVKKPPQAASASKAAIEGRAGQRVRNDPEQAEIQEGVDEPAPFRGGRLAQQALIDREGLAQLAAERERVSQVLRPHDRVEDPRDDASTCASARLAEAPQHPNCGLGRVGPGVEPLLEWRPARR